jgi:hypothetical protein
MEGLKLHFNYIKDIDGFIEVIINKLHFIIDYYFINVHHFFLVFVVAENFYCFNLFIIIKYVIIIK